MMTEPERPLRVGSDAIAMTKQVYVKFEISVLLLQRVHGAAPRNAAEAAKGGRQEGREVLVLAWDFASLRRRRRAYT